MICSHRRFSGEEGEIRTRTSPVRVKVRPSGGHTIEACRRSELNQREYCEAQGISLKAFGSWRAKFKADEPQPPARKLLYRGRGLSNAASRLGMRAVSQHQRRLVLVIRLTARRKGGARARSEMRRRRGLQ